MRIALFSLPRSRSECIFDILKLEAEQLGMGVYKPTNGNYYYIDNDKIDPNMFCKIDTRTDIDLFQEIVNQQKDHAWHVTTRDFEGFCLSFAYALTTQVFHDIEHRDYNPFLITKDQFDYAVESYAKFEQMLQMIPTPNITHYSEIKNTDTRTIHIEKDYKALCTNYDQFRDWQRVNYILNQHSERKWNCWSSFDDRNLQNNPLFADIAGSDVRMWYNIYDKGDSQDWHVHAGVRACGTRFLQIPDPLSGFEFRECKIANTEHTEIMFGPEDEHRASVNMSDIPRVTVSWNVP